LLLSETHSRQSRGGTRIAAVSDAEAGQEFLKFGIQSQVELWFDSRVVPLKSDISIVGVKARQNCGSTFESSHSNQIFQVPVSKPDRIVVRHSSRSIKIRISEFHLWSR
jgi:hypothetical protein